MKFSVITITLALLSVAGAAPIGFEKRRFGQEHTPRADADFQAMKDISNGTGFEAQLGDLSGAAVRALLAKAGACDQQDVADQCVDFAHQIGQKFATSFGPQKEADLIKVCKDYRTLERNTPNVGQPSALCDRPPKNKELNGLVQAQDPGTAAATTTPANVAATTTTPANVAATTTPANVAATTTTPIATTTTPIATTTTPKATTTTPKAKKPKNPTTTTPKAKKPKNPTTCPTTCPTTTTPAAATATTTTPDAATATTTTPAAATTTTPAAGSSNANVNNIAFTNPVGGVQMPLITKLAPGSGANFEVNGSQFQNIGAAQNRQCDIQHNLCFNKFNGGDHSFQGSDCDNQNNVCKAGDPVFSN